MDDHEDFSTADKAISDVLENLRAAGVRPSVIVDLLIASAADLSAQHGLSSIAIREHLEWALQPSPELGEE